MNFSSRDIVQEGMELKKYILPAGISMLSLAIGAGSVIGHRQLDTEWNTLSKAQSELKQNHINLDAKELELEQREQRASIQLHSAERQVAQSNKALSEAAEREAIITSRVTEIDALEISLFEQEAELTEAKRAADREYTAAKRLQKESMATQQTAAQKIVDANNAKNKYQTAHAQALRELDKANSLKANANARLCEADEKIKKANRLHAHANSIIYKVSQLENDLSCALRDKKSLENQICRLEQNTKNDHHTIRDLQNALNTAKQNLEQVKCEAREAKQACLQYKREAANWKRKATANRSHNTSRNHLAKIAVKQ